MFEHLDDHVPGRVGTPGQLAAVRNRAREISRDRRRSHLAVGSVTLTAAASVSGVAVLTGAGPLHHLDGQAGAGGSGSGLLTKSGSAVSPEPGQSGSAQKGHPGSEIPGAGKAPSPNAVSRVGRQTGNTSGEPTSLSGTSSGKCAASTDSKAANQLPTGYVAATDTKSVNDGPGYRRADGQDAKVWVKVTCLPVPADERSDHDGASYTEQTIAGRTGYVWHKGTDEAGVEWTAADSTAVYIKAVGAPGVRMSDAALLAFAESLPAT